jgi:hypothetical protein
VPISSNFSSLQNGHANICSLLIHFFNFPFKIIFQYVHKFIGHFIITVI